MIEFLSATRCTSCNRCVQVCPTEVFSSQVSGPPAISRQEECQSCFMCELYCPVDALYVAPDADRILDVNEGQITALGLLGSYRRLVGWTKGAETSRFQDQTWKVFERS